MTTFRLIERIGEGSYSKVYKAVSDTTSRTVAVKIIKFKDAPKAYIQSRQLTILRECKHQNIAALLDFILTEKAIYLVFQYFQMNLSQYYRYYRQLYNKTLDEQQIRFIMIQICSALQYLHSKGIMHRDIKPENVMINPLTQQIKLIDFGFAKHLQHQNHTGYMVTRWYRPLEIVLGLRYNEKVDVFAVGAIFLELLHGREIFQSQSNMQQLQILLSICGYPGKDTRQYEALAKLQISNTYTNPYLPTLLQKVQPQSRQLISLVLSNCPEKRPNIATVLQHLKQTPIGAAAIAAERNSIMQIRKRSNSAAHGLTLVSLVFSSREKSCKKEERESLTKDTKNQGRVYSNKQSHKRLFKIGE